MDVVFLSSCWLSGVFFGMLLVERARLVWKSKRSPVVCESTEAAVINLATGRKLFTYLTYGNGPLHSKPPASRSMSAMAMLQHLSFLGLKPAFRL
jgi:hypothetical protein